jgi:hypothetical protein
MRDFHTSEDGSDGVRGLLHGVSAAALQTLVFSPIRWVVEGYRRAHPSMRWDHPDSGWRQNRPVPALIGYRKRDRPPVARSAWSAKSGASHGSGGGWLRVIA